MEEANGLERGTDGKERVSTPARRQVSMRGPDLVWGLREAGDGKTEWALAAHKRNPEHYCSTYSQRQSIALFLARKYPFGPYWCSGVCWYRWCRSPRGVWTPDWLCVCIFRRPPGCWLGGAAEVPVAPEERRQSSTTTSEPPLYPVWLTQTRLIMNGLF